MDEMIGKDIGRFHIQEQLGEGGMATVYKAFDTELERTVAIKFIRSEFITQESAIPRFKREAQALAKLNHPNINRVLDYAWHETSPYFILEYISGGNLKQLIGQPMPWQDAAALILKVGKALAYAHGHKVVHRDIKPGNILLAEDGSPVLSDFGIAKLLEQESASLLTMSGAIVGTPAYMSPEQAQGEPADNRSDIYSLAVVFYELITGRTPFQADTPIAVIVKQINNPLPSPRETVPDLPQAVEELFFKALAKDPKNRYASMDEFNQAVEKVLSMQTAPAEAPAVPEPAEPAKPPKPAKPAAAPARKGGGMRIAAVIAAVALIAVAALLFSNRPPAAETAPPAPEDTPTTVPHTEETAPPTPAGPAFTAFLEGQVVRHVSMADLIFMNTGKWAGDVEHVTLVDGRARLSPVSSDQPGLLRDVSGNQVGNAAVLRFQVLKDSELAFEYANVAGEWDTSSYDAVWVNQLFDGRNPGIEYFIHWALWDGGSEDINLINPQIGLVAGVWYDLAVRIDARGDLTIMLWDETAGKMLWQVSEPLGYGFRQESYQLVVHAIRGAVEMAEYYEVAPAD